MLPITDKETTFHIVKWYVIENYIFSDLLITSDMNYSVFELIYDGFYRSFYINK